MRDHLTGTPVYKEGVRWGCPEAHRFVVAFRFGSQYHRYRDERKHCSPSAEAFVERGLVHELTVRHTVCKGQNVANVKQPIKRTWVKRGLIFEPGHQRPWLTSHAALPVADALADDRYRIYFSARDDKNRAQIAYVDVELKNSCSVVNLCDEPALCYGRLGSFDDSGVTSAALVTRNGAKYLYYSGWTRGVTVPFYFYVGLAVSQDDGRTFTRLSPAPILERNAVDPYLTASPAVLVESGIWRMWYVSGTGWMDARPPRHYYHIKYAESQDGVSWRRSGQVCIDYMSSDEYAISRPTIIKDGTLYRMWFATRGAINRLGYAESIDGLRWTRNDAAAGVATSASGWDSEMVTYPHAFWHKRRLHLLYNGNGYGRSGFGYAIQQINED